MTPLPKRKYAKARQGERRSHLAIKPTQLAPTPSWCPTPGRCPSPRPTHIACPECQMYRGRLLKGASQD